jgi:hypothetical protein
MMGVNDTTRIQFDPSGRAIGLPSWLGELRLAKLAFWVRDTVDARFLHSRFRELEWLPERYEAGTPEAVKVYRERGAAATEAFLRARAPSPEILSLMLFSAARALLEDSSPGRDRSPSIELLERAWAIDSRGVQVAFFLLNSLVNAGRDARCASFAEELLAFGPNLPDNIVSIIPACYEDRPPPRVESFLAMRGMAPRELRASPTGGHYRLLFEKLRARGITHVAMQYPTRPLSELEAYFRAPYGPDRPIFVSNEDNFARAQRAPRTRVLIGPSKDSRDPGGIPRSSGTT